MPFPACSVCGEYESVGTFVDFHPSDPDISTITPCAFCLPELAEYVQSMIEGFMQAIGDADSGVPGGEGYPSGDDAIDDEIAPDADPLATSGPTLDESAEAPTATDDDEVDETSTEDAAASAK